MSSGVIGHRQNTASFLLFVLNIFIYPQFDISYATVIASVLAISSANHYYEYESLKLSIVVSLSWKSPFTERLWSYHQFSLNHYGDVIMGAIASQNTSLAVIYSTIYTDADQRKHQSSASLAFVREIHRRQVNLSHKSPVTRKMFPFDDVIMFRWHICNLGKYFLYQEKIGVNANKRLTDVCISSDSHLMNPVATLTHWGRHNKAPIFQVTCLIALSWMKTYKFRLRIHWSLFSKVQLTIFQNWFE